jgi:hypothetical protein
VLESQVRVRVRNVPVRHRRVTDRYAYCADGNGRLENVVKGFVDALTAVAHETDAIVNTPPAAAAATAAAAAASSAALSPGAADAKPSKHESAWDLIRKLVKLLRTKGNQYGYAVGVRYQEWCRWNGKRDTLKGLTRVVGVRPDAWATNAKHVLLSIRNGMDTFFEWLAVQKDKDTGNAETSGNALERSVRNACRDPRTVSELWCIAVFSDGVFQPMMIAVNESDTRKSMMSMRSVARSIRHHLRRWSCGNAVDGLPFGWLMSGTGAASKVQLSADVTICGAAAYLDDGTLRALRCVSRHTLWSLFKRANTTTQQLMRLAAHVLVTFEHFIEEYLPDGALHSPSAAVRAVAAVAPPNNDAVERAFGVYDYLNSKVAVNMTQSNKEGRIVSRVNHTVEWWMAQPPETRDRALHAARTYTANAKAVIAERRQRDDELRRARARTMQTTNQRKHTKRAVKTQRNAALALWTSEAELTVAMQSVSGKTARSKALQQQLTAYKQRHNAKDVRLSKAGKPLTDEELKAQLLTVIALYGNFVTQPQPPSSTSTSTDAAPAPASASTAQPRAKSKSTTTTRRRSKAKTEANTQSAAPAAAAAAANDNTRVLQCCGVADKAAGEPCVQCDCCTHWFHCACEQVAWEAANSMDVYLCRMCLGELAPVE